EGGGPVALGLSYQLANVFPCELRREAVLDAAQNGMVAALEVSVQQLRPRGIGTKFAAVAQRQAFVSATDKLGAIGAAAGHDLVDHEARAAEQFEQGGILEPCRARAGDAEVEGR